MPSVPGKGGRMPKRTTERMGHRSKAYNDAVDKVPISGKVKIPPADPDWHPIAVRWYESLAESGQSIYYEPSDWAAAAYAAEVMHNNIKTNGSRISAQQFTGVWAAMNDLLTTEGARRRARLELERTGKDDAKNAKNMAVLNEYRSKIA